MIRRRFSNIWSALLFFIFVYLFITNGRTYIDCLIYFKICICTFLKYLTYKIKITLITIKYNFTIFDIGDSCCFSFSLGRFQEKLNNTLPGVHMISLRMGSSLINDVENSYFMHPDKQVEVACSVIKSDPKLANGYNAIGFSQGSQFL